MLGFVSLVMVSALAVLQGPSPAGITVSVASSLSDVMTEIARRYKSSGGEKVTLNVGGSNMLARQIVEGAPVDVFVSADELQMDVVAKAGHVAAGSRVPLLSNHLVVVVPRDSRAVVAQPADLAAAGITRIAMGQPDAVPAGVYGRRWLEQAGLWKTLQPKVVPLPTARAALAAVREGRVGAAIVYATDARSSPEVRVAYAVPIEHGPAIVYPAAILIGTRQVEAGRFMAFMRTDEARAVFEGAGFRVLARP